MYTCMTCELDFDTEDYVLGTDFLCPHGREIDVYIDLPGDWVQIPSSPGTEAYEPQEIDPV